MSRRELQAIQDDIQEKLRKRARLRDEKVSRTFSHVSLDVLTRFDTLASRFYIYCSKSLNPCRASRPCSSSQHHQNLVWRHWMITKWTSRHL